MTSLFGCLRCFSAERRDRDKESPSFRIYKFSVSIYGDFCILSSRGDSPREINEAERPDRMQGSRDHKSPEISNHFFIFDYLYYGSEEHIDSGRRAKIFPIYKLRIFYIRLRFYILISHRISRYRFSQMNIFADIISEIILIL